MRDVGDVQMHAPPPAAAGDYPVGSAASPLRCQAAAGCCLSHRPDWVARRSRDAERGSCPKEVSAPGGWETTARRVGAVRTGGRHCTAIGVTCIALRGTHLRGERLAGEEW